MKLLMTADLHGRWAYYQWLAEQKVDLIVIAGDLINNLGVDESEIILATHALAGFRSPVAVCSGNHDNPNLWFPILEHGGVLSDGQSKVFGNLLVTSLPFEEEEIRISGRSLLNRLACCSTGVISHSEVCALSSAKWRPWRPPSG